MNWILRDAYIDGSPFTMGGNRLRLEKVTCPEEPPRSKSQDQTDAELKQPGMAKVIDLQDLKKK